MSDSPLAISPERLLKEIGFNNSPLPGQVDKLFAGTEYQATELRGEGWEGRFLRRSISRKLGAGTLRISDVRTWFDHEGEVKDKRALVFTAQSQNGEPTAFVAGVTIND